VLTKSLVVAAVSLVSLATSASANSIGLWSTGVCWGQNNNLAACQGGVAGALLNFGANDNNYQILANGIGAPNGANSTTTESAFGPYVANNSGSEWIEPGSASLQAAAYPAGSWTVQTTFDLTGFIASSLILQLDVAVDNTVVVKINGNTISGFSPSCTAATCFTLFQSNHSIDNAAAGGYLAGINTLQFVITNTDGPGSNPTALRVQAIGNAAVIPEPGTWALLGIGLTGLGLLRRKIV